MDSDGTGGASTADLAPAPDPALDGPCPVLVMGDLSAAPDSAVLRPLRDVLRVPLRSPAVVCDLRWRAL